MPFGRDKSVGKTLRDGIDEIALFGTPLVLTRAGAAIERRGGSTLPELHGR
jgi:hypothetical protein